MERLMTPFPAFARTGVVLVDGVDLIHKYKAFVAAIPYRNRSIPIVFKAYTNQQISDMVYRSENWVVWNFMDIAYEIIQKVFPGGKVIFVFDRGFADEKLTVASRGTYTRPALHP
jgi:hypothetical protein